MALSYKARKRWSLFILVVALPAYIIVAVTLMNWIGDAFGRPPLLVELAAYIALGVLWALPLKSVFRGVGKADPETPPDGRQGGSR